MVEDIPGAATVPEIAVFIDKAWYNRLSAIEQEKLKQHEYGHYLQWQKYGTEIFWGIIAPSSLISTQISDNHQNSLVEKGANTLSKEYFGSKSLLGGDDYPIIVPTIPSNAINGVVYPGYPGF